MSGYAQHNAFFSLDNAAGTPTDYSTEIIEFSVGVKLNTGEHFTLGSRGGQITVGGYSGDISLKVKGTIAATALLSVINTWAMSATLATYSASKSFVASYPDNVTAGSHRVSGECLATDLGMIVTGKGGKGDVQAQDIKLKTDGTVLYAVI